MRSRMPLYDLKCEKCGKRMDDVLASFEDVKRMVCPDCKSKLIRVPGRFVPDVFPAEGIFLEHVSAKGKTFYSKKEMKDYAKKHDLELGALG